MQRESAASASARHTLTAGEAAWAVVVPCALALLAIVLLLGPPLGHALFEPTGANAIWPHFFRLRVVQPEPVEHARFVLALLGPVLAIAGMLALRGRQTRTGLSTALSLLGQAALLAFVVGCVVAQRRYTYEVHIVDKNTRPHVVYFKVATLALGAAFAALSAYVLSRPSVLGRIAQIVRESRMRRALAIAAAAIVTIAYLLSAFNTEGTINVAHAAYWDHIGFWSDEAFSILNGQAPLVDFHAQYGHLWAYIAAAGLSLFGASLGVYCAVMLAGTAATMAALFAMLRRIVNGSSLLALALYLPVMATGFYMKLGPPDNRYSPAGLFSVFPVRYAGPYVLLWLLVRHVDNRSRRRPLALLALAGLVVINNPEFGVPALGATLAALAWTLPEGSLRGLGRLAVTALAGGAIAVVLVSALTLIVGGSLPHFGMLLTFPRIFGTEGFGMIRMPPVGLHLVVYVTFAGAMVLAAVRGVASDDDPKLTAALAWVGVFGLGVGAYFAGRSHPQVLIDLFSAWALAIALMTVAAVRAILRRPTRRPGLAELLVLAGMGVLVCSLAQVPTPWSQIDRLQRSQPRAVRVTTAFDDAMKLLTRPGEPVAMLMKSGHQIAQTVGIADVNPYANIDSMLTREQWGETIDALQRAHGRRIFATGETLFEEQSSWLARRGYRPYATVRQLGLIELIKGPPPATGGGR